MLKNDHVKTQDWFVILTWFALIWFDFEVDKRISNISCLLFSFIFGKRDKKNAH